MIKGTMEIHADRADLHVDEPTEPERLDRADHVGAGVLEDLDDIGGRAGRFFDNLRQVLSQAVVGHAAHDRHVQLGHVGELVRIVRVRKDGLGKIEPDFGVNDINGRAEFDIADVIPAQVDMHQAGNAVGFSGIAVKMNTLHQRRGAVTHANDRDAHFLVVTHKSSSSRGKIDECGIRNQAGS